MAIVSYIFSSPIFPSWSWNHGWHPPNSAAKPLGALEYVGALARSQQRFPSGLANTLPRLASFAMVGGHKTDVF